MHTHNYWELWMNLENKWILRFIGKLSFGKYEDEKSQNTEEPTKHYSLLHPYLFLILFVCHKLYPLNFNEGLFVCVTQVRSRFFFPLVCSFEYVYCAILFRRRGSDRNLPAKNWDPGVAF